jgi:hypothetical protein
VTRPGGPLVAGLSQRAAAAGFPGQRDDPEAYNASRDARD